MTIHRVSDIGIEVWTDKSPAWDTRLERRSGEHPVFSAETPASYYPPAGMSWAVPGLSFENSELRDVAKGAVDQAARNYGLSSRTRSDIALRAARYGELSGYEAEFSAIADSTPVDVKVFVGHRPGKPAVVMHAYTLKGKLPHISEQIRRSWTNVRYLKN